MNGDIFTTVTGALAALVLGALGLTSLGGLGRSLGTVNTATLPGGSLGGQLPIGNSPVVTAALSLVPKSGEIPVAVFSRFAKGRRLPAIAVIWKEVGDTPKRRSTNEGSSFLRRVLRKGRSLILKIWQFFVGSDQTNSSTGSAFPDIDFENDLFGFRVVIRQEQPCSSSVPCNFSSITRSRNPLFGWRYGWLHNEDHRRYPRSSNSRQGTGEEYETEGFPECRTTLSQTGCVDSN